MLKDSSYKLISRSFVKREWLQVGIRVRVSYSIPNTLLVILIGIRTHLIRMKIIIHIFEKIKNYQEPFDITPILRGKSQEREARHGGGKGIRLFTTLRLIIAVGFSSKRGGVHLCGVR